MREMRDSLVEELKNLSKKIDTEVSKVNVDADFDEIEKNVDAAEENILSSEGDSQNIVEKI